MISETKLQSSRYHLGFTDDPCPASVADVEPKLAPELSLERLARFLGASTELRRQIEQLRLRQPLLELARQRHELPERPSIYDALERELADYEREIETQRRRDHHQPRHEVAEDIPRVSTDDPWISYYMLVCVKQLRYGSGFIDAFYEEKNSTSFSKEAAKLELYFSSYEISL